MKNELIKIGAAWKNVDRDGNTILLGQMGDARLVILANGFKREEKHPDYIVYVSAYEKKEQPKQDSSDVFGIEPGSEG